MLWNEKDGEMEGDSTCADCGCGKASIYCGLWTVAFLGRWYIVALTTRAIGGCLEVWKGRSFLRLVVDVEPELAAATPGALMLPYW